MYVLLYVCKFACMICINMHIRHTQLDMEKHREKVFDKYGMIDEKMPVIMQLSQGRAVRLVCMF